MFVFTLMNPLTNTTQEPTGTVSVSRVNDLLKQNKKQEVLSQELQINSRNTRSAFSQMLSEGSWVKNLKNSQGYSYVQAWGDPQCNIPSALPGRTGRLNGPANFALGSASSQLQEVLVTDLPRSFNRGERERGREKPEREEGEMKERRGREKRGRTGKKGQVFQLSLQHLSDPRGSGCALSKKLNKNMTYCTCQPCSVILLWVSLPLCPLISLYMFPSSQCWRRDCRSQSHIPVTFIQC